MELIFRLHFILFFGPLPLDEKGSHDSTTVSMSLGQQVNMFSSK